MLAVMLLLPERTTQAARGALIVWGLDVVPSLFPYMVFCRMLAAKLKRSRLPAAPAAAILGLMGGSPSGASVIAAYGESLTRREAFCLAALTGTISPMFLLNTVQAWVHDAQLCRQLLAAHLLGAAFSFIVVLVCTRRAENDAVCFSAQSAGDSDSPILQCVDSTLGVGGCIVFFSVLAAGVSALFPGAPPQLTALFHAALEAAGGLHALACAVLPANLFAVLAAAMSGFSGLSILTQNLLFLRPLGLTMKHLTAFALLRSLGAAVAMALLRHFA